MTSFFTIMAVFFVSIIQVFVGGILLFFSPRRLRAKYPLRTNLRFIRREFRPAEGKFAQAQIYTVRKSWTVFIHAAGRTGAWIAMPLTATFQGRCAASQRGFTERSPLWLSENDSLLYAQIWESAHSQQSYNGCLPKNCVGRLSTKGKAFMKRNSFIEMAKLHNLSGRITYISSHARQEYLYEVYATVPDRASWRELAKCNQEEFKKSGTNGKCIEARELMIALLESFINYDYDSLLKKMVDGFKEKYGVECFAAIHHNKRKTNLHIHMIFAERKRLEQPVEKIATRNMFYDERGHHVRTKKEILDGDGNIRKDCKIIKKGEVYEHKIFTIKDERFKQESFLDGIKVFYTDLINQMVLDDKDRLSIFDKNGPYLATKKVGKNNPKAEEVKADNEIRMEWNRAVDRAIVSGVPDTEVIELKKAEITDKVRESVEQNGKKPELFGEIVKAAILLLELLITKAMQKVMDIAEKVIGNGVGDAKETDSCIHTGDNPVVQPERKKIPLPVNLHRGLDRKKNTEYPAVDSTEKESIIKRIKAEQEPAPVEKEQTAERPPQPKPSVLASKYPRLKEIEGRLKEQNKAIFEREKKKDMLKEELSECTGIFKGGSRKELQQEIDSLDFQISNMKKRLSSIVKEYNFDSVQAFYKELNAAKRENQNYEAACAEYEKTYGEKVMDTRSVRNRLRQKERAVKEREVGRAHQTRQKDKGAR